MPRLVVISMHIQRNEVAYKLLNTKTLSEHKAHKDKI